MARNGYRSPWVIQASFKQSDRATHEHGLSMQRETLGLSGMQHRKPGRWEEHSQREASQRPTQTVTSFETYLPVVFFQIVSKTMVKGSLFVYPAGIKSSITEKERIIDMKENKFHPE